MKKVVKWVLIVLGVLLLLVLAALLSLPLWIGRVVPPVANDVVPGVTQTGFHMDAFELNPYKGTIHIGGTVLENPKRFLGEVEEAPAEDEGIGASMLRGVKNATSAVGNTISSPETNALSFASIDVKLSTTSLVTDKIQINEIVIKDLYLYASASLAANWREIIDATAGDDGETEKKEEPVVEETEGGTTVVIDRILIEGLVVKYGSIVVTLTDPIEILDIGKEEPTSGEGAFDTVVLAVCDAVEGTSSVAGTGLKAAYLACKALVTGTEEVAEGGATMIKGGVDAVTGLFGGSEEK